MYSKIGGKGGGSYSGGLQCPPPNPPAAKIGSQSDAQVRTDA